MINLIPNQDKKKMARDFYMRLVALSLAMLAMLVFFASAAMLPAYISSSVKKNVAEEKLEAQKKDTVPELDKETLSAIQGLNAKLALIEAAEKNKFPISEHVMTEVIGKKMPDIHLTQITYQNDAIKGRTVSVLGIAPSRERLLLFRKALEDDASFKSVDLPISNFLKGSNIQFNMIVTIK